jgi:hypothetical protein
VNRGNPLAFMRLLQGGRKVIACSSLLLTRELATLAPRVSTCGTLERHGRDAEGWDVS